MYYKYIPTFATYRAPTNNNDAGRGEGFIDCAQGGGRMWGGDRKAITRRKTHGKRHKNRFSRFKNIIMYLSRYCVWRWIMRDVYVHNTRTRTSAANQSLNIRTRFRNISYYYYCIHTRMRNVTPGRKNKTDCSREHNTNMDIILWCVRTRTDWGNRRSHGDVHT